MELLVHQEGLEEHPGEEPQVLQEEHHSSEDGLELEEEPAPVPEEHQRLEELQPPVEELLCLAGPVVVQQNLVRFHCCLENAQSLALLATLKHRPALLEMATEHLWVCQEKVRRRELRGSELAQERPGWVLLLLEPLQRPSRACLLQAQVQAQQPEQPQQ